MDVTDRAAGRMTAWSSEQDTVIRRGGPFGESMKREVGLAKGMGGR